VTDLTPVVDPRREARERVGGRFDARVLEPSPPPTAEPPWFADDPVNDGDGPAGAAVLAPVPGLGSTWDELAQSEPDLAPWCADRWLGAWRALEIPADLAALEATRRSWHALAEHVVAPARHRANGKIGLRFTRGGYGSPFFGSGEQVCVMGDTIVVTRGGSIEQHTVRTVAAAARAIGIEPGAPTEVYSPTTPLEPDAALAVDAGAARFIGDWFGFGASVLEELRATVPMIDAPARVQLWPEHFDLSVDLGDEGAGRRATFGASPGDDAHPLPYAYVSPWEAQTGAFWNETTFASLSLTDFAAAADQRRAVLDFFARARTELSS
jgi:hypothetical protein